jgi:hypothetical protein
MDGTSRLARRAKLSTESLIQKRFSYLRNSDYFFAAMRISDEFLQWLTTPGFVAPNLLFLALKN